MLIRQQIKANEIEQLLDNKSINKLLNYIRDNGGISAEINEILFKRYHLERDNGVLLEDITARTVLILANENLIGFVFKNFIDYNEDLYSVAKIGLIRAVDSFCLEKGAFTTYAIRVMLNEIYTVNRLSKNKIERKHAISSFDDVINEFYINSNGDNQITWQDIVADEYDFRLDVMDEDLIKYIKSLFKYLSPIEQKVLIYYTGLNGAPQLNQVEMSPVVGYNQSNISRILKRAIKKINKLLSGEDCSNMKVYELVEVEKAEKHELLGIK